MLDVEEVVLQLLCCVFDAGAVRVAHLCPAGQSGTNHVPLAVERNLLAQLLDELGPLRPGADEAHVARDDVPQLRQLVETRASDEAPDPRHARIVLLGPYGTSAGFGVLAHRPKLM